MDRQDKKRIEPIPLANVYQMAVLCAEMMTSEPSERMNDEWVHEGEGEACSVPNKVLTVCLYVLTKLEIFLPSNQFFFCSSVALSDSLISPLLHFCV